MQIRQFYKNMAIQKKMIIMFLGIMTALLVLILSVTNVILYHSNMTKIEKSIQMESSVIGMRLDTIICLGIFGGCLGLAAVCILSKQITKPIQELTSTASMIGTGNLTCRCQVRSEDEIGSLGRTFNSMLDKIGTLMNQVKQEQKKKRESELALFQVQIKPHFLYNTLDLIYVCCEMDDGKEGAKIAKALADYYRTCLSGGEEVISIREELKNIRNYLYIRRERYKDIMKSKGSFS